MRRMIILSAMILAAIVLAFVAYPAYRAGQTAGEPLPPAPVTVPVSRGEVAHTVTAPGQLGGTRERMVVAGAGGRLLEMAVRPGSVVRAGEVLARVDPAPFAAALENARLRLHQAELAHAHQLATATLAVEAGEAQVASARARIPSPAAAEVNLAAARDDERRAAAAYQAVQARPWEAAEVVEGYRLEWVSAQRALEIAEAVVERARNEQEASREEANALAREVAASALTAEHLAESGVDPLLQMAVDQAEAALAQTTITAPFAGVVLDVLARPGQQLAPGANLALLADPSQGEVRTTVIEEDLALVTIGQTATVYFDARPEAAVSGKVSRIVPRRVVGEARPLYHVYLSLDEPLPEGVYPGMTADAALLIERVEDILRLPRAVVAARSDGTATVDVWENGRAVAREISTGLRGDVFIAILEGLDEGDEIVGE